MCIRDLEEEIHRLAEADRDTYKKGLETVKAVAVYRRLQLERMSDDGNHGKAEGEGVP